MEKPATRASPEEGGNSVVSILMVVVLPAPLEPSRAKTSPALTERVTASTAVNVPKRRVRSLISRTMSLIGIISSATFQRLSPVRRPDTCGRKGSTRCHKRCKRHRSNTSLPPRIPDRDPPAGTRSRRMRSADTPCRTRGWASGTSVDCRKKDRRCSEEYSNRHNLRAATRCDAGLTIVERDPAAMCYAPATRPGFAIPSAVATRLPAAGYAAVAVVAVPAAVAAAVAESVGPAVAAVVERVAPAAVAVASAVAVAVGPAVAAVVGRALPAAVGVASAVAVAVGPAVAAVVERALPAAAAVASAVAVAVGPAVAAVVERALPAAVGVASAVAVAVGPAVAAVVERALPAAAAVAFAAAVAVAVERVSPAAAPAVASQAACLVYPAARAKG